MRARSLRDVVEDGEGRGPGHMRTQLAIGLSKGAGTLTQRRGRGWRRAWARTHAHATGDMAEQGCGHAHSETWSRMKKVVSVLPRCFCSFFGDV